MNLKNYSTLSISVVIIFDDMKRTQVSMHTCQRKLGEKVFKNLKILICGKPCVCTVQSFFLGKKNVSYKINIFIFTVWLFQSNLSILLISLQMKQYFNCVFTFSLKDLLYIFYQCTTSKK
jgi:hypothetical protein